MVSHGLTTQILLALVMVAAGVGARVRRRWREMLLGLGLHWLVWEPRLWRCDVVGEGVHGDLWMTSGVFGKEKIFFSAVYSSRVPRTQTSLT